MQDVTSGNETRETSHIAILFLVCLEGAKHWGKLVICRKYMWNGENGREVRMGGSWECVHNQGIKRPNYTAFFSPTAHLRFQFSKFETTVFSDTVATNSSEGCSGRCTCGNLCKKDLRIAAQPQNRNRKCGTEMSTALCRQATYTILSGFSLILKTKYFYLA